MTETKKKGKRRIVQIEIIVFGTIFEKIIQLNNETSSKPVKIEFRTRRSSEHGS